MKVFKNFNQQDLLRSRSSFSGWENFFTRRDFLKVSASGLFFLLSGCRNDGRNSARQKGVKKRVKIGYLPITHALPVFVAKETGNREFYGIELELIRFGSWPELIEALNAGRIDGASVLVQLAMGAREQGADLKAVALGHTDGNAIVVAHDIDTPSDLKGRTFAIPHRFSSHNMLLYMMLTEAGIDYSDLKVVDLPPPEMPAALSEGRISGYCVAEPFGAVSVAHGRGKALFKSEDLWQNSVCCVLVLRGELIRNSRDAAGELVREYIRAGKYIDSKADIVNDTAMKYMRLDQKVIDLSLQWISYNDLKIYEKDYNYLREYMIKMNLSTNPPSYPEFVDNTFIESFQV